MDGCAVVFVNDQNESCANPTELTVKSVLGDLFRRHQSTPTDVIRKQ